MANFYVAHVVPILQRYQGPVKISDANPAQTLRNLSKYADMITTVLYYVPIGELLFPLVCLERMYLLLNSTSIAGRVHSIFCLPADV